MSTYTGAATLVNVLSVALNGDGIQYTTPAGFFSEVNIIKIRYSGNSAASNSLFRVGNEVLYSQTGPGSSSPTSLDLTFFTLNEGMGVSISSNFSGGIFGQIVVKEYNKP